MFTEGSFNAVPVLPNITSTEMRDPKKYVPEYQVTFSGYIPRRMLMKHFNVFANYKDKIGSSPCVYLGHLEAEKFESITGC